MWFMIPMTGPFWYRTVNSEIRINGFIPNTMSFRGQPKRLCIAIGRSRQDLQTAFDNTNTLTFPITDLQSENFYDNYAFTSRRYSTSYSAYWRSGYIIAHANSKVKTLQTGSKVRILGTTNFLETVIFYDDNYRPIQVHSQNHLGGWDVLSTQYDFTGNVMADHWWHKIQGKNPLRISRYYDYDHQGRLLEEQMKIDNKPREILAIYDYDELGQLKSKQMGVSVRNTRIHIQEQVYSYNIRGWLLGVNDPISVSHDRPFAYKLQYETKSDGSEGYYNGNISGQTWASITDQHPRHYDYSYDELFAFKISQLHRQPK